MKILFYIILVELLKCLLIFSRTFYLEYHLCHVLLLIAIRIFLLFNEQSVSNRI